MAQAQGQFYSAPYYCQISPSGDVTIEGTSTAPEGAVVIPSTIAGSPVTSLGQGAFSGWSAVTSITLPSSITDIYPGAFASASYNGSVLATITLATNNPAYVSIGGVLYTQPETQLFAFPPASTATSYAVPASVTTLGIAAFAYCSNLDSVAIPSSVTSIQDRCFVECTGLTGIVIPSSVSSIGETAFGYTSLSNVVISDSVTNLGSGAFTSCSSLTNLTLGSGVTSIEPNTFSSSGLVSITIPNTVASINNYAFWYSPNLAAAFIGSGATNIGLEAFAYCPRLTEINVAPANPTYSSPEGVLFDKGQTELLQYPNGKAGAYVLPASVGGIEQLACTCASLSSVTFDQDLTNIGQFAFVWCSNLTSLVVPSGVTMMGYQAFYGCPSLTNAVLEGSSIGSQAFAQCSNLVTVSLGPGVSNIEDSAFAACPNLRALYFQGNAPALVPDAFEQDSATVYYRAGTSGWTNTYGGMPAVALNGLTFTATPSNGIAPLTVAFTAPSTDSAGNAITH
jgi:hypothetical protein